MIIGTTVVGQLPDSRWCVSFLPAFFPSCVYKARIGLVCHFALMLWSQTTCENSYRIHLSWSLFDFFFLNLFKLKVDFSKGKGKKKVRLRNPEEKQSLTPATWEVQTRETSAGLLELYYNLAGWGLLHTGILFNSPDVLWAFNRQHINEMARITLWRKGTQAAATSSTLKLLLHFLGVPRTR